MLFRFSLYGFLKNQRYFEPFLLLAFLDRGLTFTTVGLLVALRELCVNVMEIPSGALADSLGRRRVMIASFVAYVAAFALLGWTTTTAPVWAAMPLLAVGDALRTGTHKAMIFSWLRSQGRTDERTRVYGFTRSWSKLGSAASTLLGAGIVLASDGYTLLFQLATIPYVLGIVNFLGYPAELDGNEGDQKASASETFRTLRDALRTVLRRPPLRSLVIEGLAFGGTFKAIQDYLQPLLLIALGGSLVAHTDPRTAALAVGPAYIVIYLGSSWASRNAHRVVEWSRGEEVAARRLWVAVTLIYSLITAGLLAGTPWLAVPAFGLLFLLQNVFRPILVARFDEHSEAEHGATVLSIESQVSRLGTVALAPAIGLAVDAAREADPSTGLWPAGVAGLVIAGTMLGRRTRSTT